MRALRAATETSACCRSASARAARRRGLRSTISRREVVAVQPAAAACEPARAIDQRLGQRLDRQRAHDGLGGLGLPLGRREVALLAQPLDRRLDAVRLARLAEVRAARDEVAQRARVVFGDPRDVEQRARRREARERLPRLDGQLPAQALRAGPQGVGGAIPGSDTGAERARPRDGLRHGVASSRWPWRRAPPSAAVVRASTRTPGRETRPRGLLLGLRRPSPGRHSGRRRDAPAGRSPRSPRRRGAPRPRGGHDRTTQEHDAGEPAATVD